MPRRQVFVFNPDTGRCEHAYQDLGPGAAKPKHGASPSTSRSAVGPSKFVPNTPAISNPRRAS
jgi:hypothetical protein